MCNIGGRIGQYHYNPANPPVERVVGNVTFLIGIATAYNALGLIGTEGNGIFVLDDTNRNVVLDEHECGQLGGFGPYGHQKQELARILELPDADFLAFIRAHPRFRKVYLPRLVA